jgi:hypothetical protein
LFHHSLTIPLGPSFSLLEDVSKKRESFWCARPNGFKESARSARLPRNENARPKPIARAGYIKALWQKTNSQSKAILHQFVRG